MTIDLAFIARVIIRSKVIANVQFSFLTYNPSDDSSTFLNLFINHIFGQFLCAVHVSRRFVYLDAIPAVGKKTQLVIGQLNEFIPADLS